MKKTKYLVAALLLMGATTTFTSCIDNDEPAGITELRGAKAALLNAKAAVETARAAYIDAVTREKNAYAELQEIKNEKEKLRLALLEAKTESEIAWYKAQLEINKVKWEQELLQAQMNLEITKKDYEDLMEYLEAAENVLSGREEALLASAKQDVQNAFDYLEDRHEALITAQGQLNTAYENYDPETAKVTLENSKERYELLLETENKNLAYYESMLNKDWGTTELEAEIKELKDSVEVLTLNKAEFEKKFNEFTHSEEYQTAYAKVTETTNEFNTAKVPAEFEYEVPEYVKTQLEVKVSNIGHFYEAEEEGKFNFVISEEESAAGVRDNVLIPAVEALDEIIENYTSQEDANLEGAVEKAEEALEDAQEGHKKQVAAWKTALDKYNQGKDYDETDDYNAAKKVIEDAYKTTFAPGSTASLEEQLIAKNQIAAALVKYYDAVNAKVGLSTIKVKMTVTVGGIADEIEKTVYDWISEDPNYGGSRLWSIFGVKSISGGADVVIAATMGTANSNVVTSTLLESKGTEAGLLTSLQDASRNAFGWAKYYVTNTSVEGYLTVEPSNEEMRLAFERTANENNSSAITAMQASTGYKLTEAEDALEDAKVNTGAKEIYIKFKEALDAQLLAINEHLADLEAAKEAAEEAFKTLEEEALDIKAESDAVQKQINVVNSLINKLQEVVEGALQGNSSVEDVINWAKGKINETKDLINGYQKQINLLNDKIAQIENGTYTSEMWVEYWEEQVEFNKAVYEQAQTLYSDAMSRLQKIVETLTKTAE